MLLVINCDMVDLIDPETPSIEGRVRMNGEKFKILISDSFWTVAAFAVGCIDTWVLLRNAISTYLSEFLLSQTGLKSMSISHAPVGLEGSRYNGEGLNRLLREVVESPSLDGNCSRNLHSCCDHRNKQGILSLLMSTLPSLEGQSSLRALLLQNLWYR